METPPMWQNVAYLSLTSLPDQQKPGISLFSDSHHCYALHLVFLFSTNETLPAAAKMRLRIINKSMKAEAEEALSFSIASDLQRGLSFLTS